MTILIFTKTFSFRITNFGLFVLLYPPNLGDIMLGALGWHYLQVQIIAATETYKLTSVKNSIVNVQPSAVK